MKGADRKTQNGGERDKAMSTVRLTINQSKRNRWSAEKADPGRQSKRR